jgi:predicted short-subunit dehydrogenase-like oxidoreductase (DUF2520 family)
MSDPAEHHSLASFGAWGFVGAGALGGSLARALAARGATIAAVSSRHHERAQALASSLPDCAVLALGADVVLACDAVVLAIPDDAIPILDAELPWRPAQVVLHLSGARGLDVLAHAGAAGAHAGALHPLMIFPRAEPSGADALARFAGCAWASETSDDTAATAVRAIVAALGGRVVALRPADRVPYHLSAVLASNYIVTLLGAAIALWQDFGLEPTLAREALLPLTRATVERLAEHGPAAALAGPIARGDLGTVAAHLAWLRERRTQEIPGGYGPDDLAAAYRALARLTLPLAVERGSLTPAIAAELLDLLDHSAGTDRATP